MRIIRSVAASLGLAVALTSATTATGETGHDATRSAALLHDDAGHDATRSAALLHDDADGRNWPAFGRSYGEQHYSPLAAINRDNVERLGLAWSLDLPAGNVATGPIAVDGVVFFASGYSIVHAVDAVTGRLLWTYDPKVPEAAGAKLRTVWGSRGIAWWNGKVYTGTADGRLIAIDAKSGRPVWSVMTVDPADVRFISGAPRVFDGKIIIGHGGADFGDLRGYVTTYDAETGRQLWRFYTVPGDPAKPQESKALERALPTWQGGEWWKYGGGGTVWDSMAFDPELDLLYVGTGNGGPWLQKLRGTGDNLYVASILALRPDTGELVWHYQTTPGDNWDYTATQHILLADLELDGRPRKVLMQAPKNGYFWVLDRETGAFVSAAPYTTVTWSKGIDAKGRPIVDPAFDYRHEPKLVHPGPAGGHNWHPMSFHPGTGLVYIPAYDIPMLFDADHPFRFRPGELNTGLDFTHFAAFDEGAPVEVDAFLLAWDPVAQREVWRVPHVTTYNGGVLSTAGNLVFQGTADGRLVAYRATDGEKRWEAPAGTGVMAAPGSKPNIVSIVADDLGWKDVGFHGSDIRTPNIDHLAAEGLKLEQFYALPMRVPTSVARCERTR